jgi:CO/xanthine dehydrogenase Mo-binding subunit
MGDAVHKACQDAIRQMRELVAWQQKTDAEKVTFEGGTFRAGGPAPDTPAGRGALAWDDVARLSLRRGKGPIVGVGSSRRLKPAPTFGAHVADVEVDPETGRVTLLAYTVFQDCGLAVNPVQVEGQMQGGAAQGIGWALNEEYVYEDGVIQNRSLLDYRMPTALDLPMIGTEIVECRAEDGPFGVRGCGEAPIIPPIAAIANAIANATGVRINPRPLPCREGGLIFSSGPEGGRLWAAGVEEGTPCTSAGRKRKRPSATRSGRSSRGSCRPTGAPTGPTTRRWRRRRSTPSSAPSPRSWARRAG